MIGQTFIVRSYTGYALKFVKNACGEFVNSVLDKDATPFPNEEAAKQTAIAYRLREMQFRVEPLPQVTPVDFKKEAGDLRVSLAIVGNNPHRTNFTSTKKEEKDV